MNYEKGDIDANRPRTIPPGDLITPWFNDIVVNGVTIPALRNIVLKPSEVGMTNVDAVTAAHAAGNLGIRRPPVLLGRRRLIQITIPASALLVAITVVLWLCLLIRIV